MELSYFEPRFWGLDPVFSSKVKLNVCEVLSLKHYPGFPDVYCLLNHAVGQVHIMGDVLSVVEKTRLIKYEVDDGTGVINCTQWRRTDDSNEGLCVASRGQLVSVFGKVSEFREEKQITVTSICPETDPNVEPLFWLETIKLKKEVYSKPFQLPPGIDSSATSVSVSLQEVVYPELKKWVHSKYSDKSFTLRVLENDVSLTDVCVKVLDDQNKPHSRPDVEESIRAALRKLQSDGVIVSTSSSSRGTELLYKIFSPEKDLFPMVTKYILKREQSDKVLQLGVPEEWIIEHIQQQSKLSLSRAVIVETISAMVDNSIIYPINPKSYRLV